MPMYDYRAEDGCVSIDVWEPIEPVVQHVCAHGIRMERAWIGGNGPKAIGDECDVWVKNGICWPNGEPRHYDSKSAMKREADAQGLVNRVRHIGTKGGDRSKHTSRWI